MDKFEGVAGKHGVAKTITYDSILWTSHLAKKSTTNKPNSENAEQQVNQLPKPHHAFQSRVDHEKNMSFPYFTMRLGAIKRTDKLRSKIM